VRHGALDAIDAMGSDAPPVLLTSLLSDSTALLRMEAARILVANGVTPTADTPPELVGALQAYLDAQRVNYDQAGSHVNVGVIHEHLGDDPAAVAAYGDALRIDSLYTPALVNLGLLYGRQASAAGEGPEADSLRSDALACFRRAAAQPGPAGARAAYYLGLLLAEDPAGLEAAAVELERAARRLGTDGRAFYNAGLAFQSLGDAGRAAELLRRAQALSPADPDPVNALVILFVQEERWDEALEVSRSLEELLPGNPAVAERSAWIAARAAGGQGDPSRADH
jgi:tetratricopeptide (TPR) repeat protein